MAKIVWSGTEVFGNLGSSGLSLTEQFSVSRELAGPQVEGSRCEASATLQEWGEAGWVRGRAGLTVCGSWLCLSLLVVVLLFQIHLLCKSFG